MTSDYAGSSSYRFNGGRIHQVVIDVSGEPFLDMEKEAVAMMSRE